MKDSCITFVWNKIKCPRIKSIVFNLLNNTNKSKIMLDVKNKSHEQIEDCGTIWDVHQIHCKKKKETVQFR